MTLVFGSLSEAEAALETWAGSADGSLAEVEILLARSKATKAKEGERREGKQGRAKVPKRVENHSRPSIAAARGQHELSLFGCRRGQSEGVFGT